MERTSPGQRAPGSTTASPAARPTSRDVARAAGVSQATVSLVLGGKWRGRVSVSTAETVREAAGRLGYQPNLAARTLREGRARTVLLVVPALTNDFFARVHTGVASVAAEHGFGLVLYSSPEISEPAPDPFGSARAAVDGVIASSMAAEALSTLREGGLPLVMLDSEPGRPHSATVNVDLPDGVRRSVRHLLALGHRRFAHLAADVDSWTFRLRADVLTQGLRDGGSAPARTEYGPLSVEGGLRAATRALTVPSGAARPTALLCDDDQIAAGACKAARRLGLRVPEDVSVTGIGDLALATAVEPELTTVGLPGEGVGAAGMRALLARLAGRAPTTEVLPVEFLPRGSTGPAPEGANGHGPRAAHP
ncbi:LacI family DNA-binding transcriptional regulator [Streptomyces sp. AJS327]|uniref:LacI family DNA-binding transcriptional regulator n=1 Tax=Streptomyces sp. AJS327 TaxID=2545265 RepID=UPI0015DF3D5B|nr:LacI family DNA-binding transcriptional regulator [Streptomyces sp. AJS327]